MTIDNAVIKRIERAQDELDAALALIGDAADVPWDRDISAELATNLGPWPRGDTGGPSLLDRDGGWWPRTWGQIDKVTFHHTLSDSPHATASHYIVKSDKYAVGRPSIPYTIWVTQTGEILKCVDLTEGLWHDHTGHENTHLSVGLAGSLHINHPADVQLDAAARVAVWAIEHDSLHKIKDIDDITGHQDWVATACPGWNYAASGNWKPELYERIKALL